MSLTNRQRNQSGKKRVTYARRRMLLEQLEDRRLMAKAVLQSAGYLFQVASGDSITVAQVGNNLRLTSPQGWQGDTSKVLPKEPTQFELPMSFFSPINFEGEGNVNIGDTKSVLRSYVTVKTANLTIVGNPKLAVLETTVGKFEVLAAKTLEVANWFLNYHPNVRQQNGYFLSGAVNASNVYANVQGADIEVVQASAKSPNRFTLSPQEIDKLTATATAVQLTTDQTFNVSADFKITGTNNPQVTIASKNGILFNKRIETLGSSKLSLKNNFRFGSARLQFPGSGADFIKSISFESSADQELQFKIDGSTPDSGYERLVIDEATQSLDLSGMKLKLVGSYNAAIGDKFTLISLNPASGSSAAIKGNFLGLLDGTLINLNSKAYRIDYSARTVSLTVIGPAETPAVAMTSNQIRIPSDPAREPSLSDRTNMGNVRLGEIGKAFFVVQNIGLSDLVFTDTTQVTVTGDSRFRISTQPKKTVVARDITYFELEFNPSTALGIATAVVSFKTNVPGATVFSFKVSATTIAGDPLPAGTTVDKDNVRYVFLDNALKLRDNRISSTGAVQIGLVPTANRSFTPLLQTNGGGESILQTNGEFETSAEIVAPSISGSANAYKPIVVFRKPKDGEARTLLSPAGLTGSPGMTSDRFGRMAVLENLFYTPSRLRLALNAGGDPQVELRGGKFTDTYLADDYSFSFGDRDDVNKDGDTELHPTDYFFINTRLADGRGLDASKLKGLNYPGSTSLNLNQPRLDNPISPGAVYYAREAFLSKPNGQWSITGSGTVTLGVVQLPATFMLADILDNTGKVSPPKKAIIQNTFDSDGKTVYEAFQFAGINLQSNNFRTRISDDAFQATLYWAIFSGVFPGGTVELQAEPEGTNQMVLSSDGKRDFKFKAPGNGYSKLTLGGLQVDFVNANAFSYDPSSDSFNGTGAVNIWLPRGTIQATISAAAPLKISRVEATRPSKLYPGTTEVFSAPSLNQLSFDIAAGTRISISDAESVTVTEGMQLKFDPAQGIWTIGGKGQYVNNESGISASITLDGTKADGSKTLGLQYSAGRFIGGEAIVNQFTYSQPNYAVPFTPESSGSLIAKFNSILNSTIVPNSNPGRVDITYTSQFQILGTAMVKIQGVSTRVGFGTENTAGVLYARLLNGQSTRLVDFMIYPANRNAFVTVGGLPLGGQILRGVATDVGPILITGEATLPIGEAPADATFSIKLTGENTIDPQLRFSTLTLGGLKLVSLSSDPLRSGNSSTTSKLILIGSGRIPFLENRKIDVILNETSGIVVENGKVTIAKFIPKEFVLGSVVYRPDALVAEYTTARNTWLAIGTAKLVNSTAEVYLWDFGGKGTTGLEFGPQGLIAIGFTNVQEVNFQGIKFAPNALTVKYDAAKTRYTLIGKGTFLGPGGSEEVTVGEDPSKTQYLIEKGVARLLNFRPVDAGVSIAAGTLAASTQNLTFRFEGGQVIYTGLVQLYSPFGNALQSAYTQHYITLDLGADGTRGMIFRNGVFESIEGVFIRIEEKLYQGYSSTAVVEPTNPNARVTGNINELSIFTPANFLVDTGLTSISPAAPNRAGVLRAPVTFEYKAWVENFKAKYLWKNSFSEAINLGDTKLTPEGGYMELSRTTPRRFDVLGYWKINAAGSQQVTLFQQGDFYLNNGPLFFAVKLTNPVSFGGTVLTPVGAYIVFSAGKGKYDGDFQIPVFSGATGTVSIASDKLQVDSKGKLKLDGLSLSVASNNFKTSKGDKGFTFKGMRLSYRTVETKDDKTGEIYIQTIATGTATIALRSGVELSCTIELIDDVPRSVEVSAEGDRLIPIAGGIVTITRISAKLDNLNEPDNFKLVGSVSANIGPRVTIFGKKVQLADATGTIEISKQELVIGGEVRVAEGAFGSGRGTVKFFFDSQSTHVVVLDAEYNLLPGDIIHGSIDFKLARNGDVDFDGSVELRVPNGIPLIGGKTVAKASIEIRIRPSSELKASYVRGEASILSLATFDAKVDFSGEVDIGVRPLFFKRFSKTFTLPGIRNTVDDPNELFGSDYVAPTIAIQSIEPIAGTSQAKITYTATADPALREFSYVDLYIDTNSSGHQGVLIGSVPYEPGTHEFIWNEFGQYSPIPYDPQHVIYAYAAINDSENFSVLSDYSTPIHLPDLTPAVRLPKRAKVTAESTLTFSSANQNTIEIVDPLEQLDPEQQLEIIIDANYGDLHLNQSSSTVLALGQDTTRLRLIGTASDITDVLAGLEYRRHEDAVADDQLLLHLTRSPAQFTTFLEVALPIDVSPVVIMVDGKSETEVDADPAEYVQDSGREQLLADISIDDMVGYFGTKVTVGIGGYVPGEDLLTYDNIFTPAIEGQWDAHTGTLELVNFNTIEEYERALKNVFFETTGERAGKSLEIHIYNDAGELGVFELPIAIEEVNEAPEIDPQNSSLFYASTSGSTAGVPVFPALELNEPDSDAIASATIAFEVEDYVAGEDVLSFTSNELITGSFDVARGQMTLSGIASVDQYQAALRQVKYSNSSSNPTLGYRSLSVSVVDARTAVSFMGAKLAVLAAGELYGVPSVSLGAPSGTLATPDAPWTIAPDLSIETGTSAWLTSATLSITDNYSPGEDLLEIDEVPAVFEVDFDAEEGTLTITGEATAADYQALLRTAFYRNRSSVVSGDVRRFTIQVSDGVMDSSAVSVSMNLLAPPVIQSVDDFAEFTEVHSRVPLVPEIELAYDEEATLTQAVVWFSSGYIPDQDRLNYESQESISGVFNVTEGTLVLNGVATVASYQRALRSITYSNAHNAPFAGYRQIDFTVSDGTNDSDPTTLLLSVDAEPAPPRLVIDRAAEIFVEAGAPMLIAPEFTIQDLDAAVDAEEPLLYGATISIANFVAGEDRLDYTAVPGLHAEFDGESGKLFVYGVQPLSVFQSLIRTVTYQNLSGSPTETPRTIEIAVSDGYQVIEVNDSVVVDGVEDAPTRDAGTLAPVFVLTNHLPQPIGLSDVHYLAPPLPAAQASSTSAITIQFIELPDADLVTLILPDGSAVNTSSSYTVEQLKSLQVLPVFGRSGVTQLKYSVAAIDPLTGRRDPAHLLETLAIQVEDAASRNDDDRHVAQIYRDLTGRNPTALELQDAGDTASIYLSLDPVIDSLMAKPEFVSTLANRIYDLLLVRTATSAEVQAFQSTDSLSVLGLTTRIVASDEFYELHTDDDNSNYIDMAYRAVVGRSATRNEIAQWSNRVGTASQRMAFASSIADDDAALENVARTIHFLLTRQNPTAVELDRDLETLVGSGTRGLIKAIVGGSEYRAIFTAPVGSNPFEAVTTQNEVTSNFESVGLIAQGSLGLGSGTLITDRIVLTAAHVVVDKPIDQLTVKLGNQVYHVSQLAIHPDYQFSKLGQDGGNDIAVLLLDSPVVDIEPAILNRDAPEVGDVVTLVGFGARAGQSFGEKRAGTTPIDALSPTLLRWTFDNLSESTTAAGDSGGGLFTQRGARYYLTGIISGGSHLDGSLGDQAYNTRIDAYMDWIEQFAGELPVDFVPTNIQLGALRITTESELGDAVGEFTVTGADPDALVIELMEGDGSEDNDFFELDGTLIRLKQALPIPLPSELRLRVRATDDSGISIESSFVMDIISQWQNSSQPFDVNDDQFVVPLDVLVVVNFINDHGITGLQEFRDLDLPYLDVNGDGVVGPLDALQIINYLNAQSLTPPESEAASARIAAIDAAILHNHGLPADVDADGQVTVLDALVVLEAVNNEDSSRWLGEPSYYFDVNDDKRLTALDMLLVINELRDEVTPYAP